MSTEGSSHAHYSVTRGQHRRDPNFISCLNSDGDSSKWKTTGLAIDSTGATCYWKTDDPECEALAEKWKKTCGKTVAKLLGLADDGTDEDWRVKDFPKDYKLYRHVKGQREDLYLFGSEHVLKFRTANEFSPHFHWLCTYEPTIANRIYCKCKYCSGVKNQGSVNSSLGISEKNKRFSSPVFDHSKSVSHNKRKAEEEMAKENYRKRASTDGRPARGTQKPVQSRKSLPAHVLNSVASGGSSGRKQTYTGPYVNKDRDRDLSEIKSTFRVAELVWCKLDKPINGRNEGRPDLEIDYWPAICEERMLISQSEVSRVIKDQTPQSTNKNNNKNKNNNGSNSNKSPPTPSPPSLKVQQKHQWKVRLLATCDILFKDESELLPYLNYPPPLNIYKLPIRPQTLKYIHDGHESDRPTISSLTTLSEAVTPFALSLQITAHVKKSYTLMDRYDIPLLKRIEARGQNIPIEDIQVLYEDAALSWYQYLWWGAEKIWSGELIRLIVSSNDLPNGLREFTKPSTSSSTSDSSSSRCFFLKITGIYRSNEDKGMVKGPIFELAPLEQRTKDSIQQDPEFIESDKLPGIQQVNRYMPKAPIGFYFRRLTPVGKEHHLVLQHIAGRYYAPQPTSNPPNGTAVVKDDVPEPMSIEGRSLILSGMAEGRWLHMHCETWTVDRKECFKESEAAAERELIAYCSKTEEKKKEATGAPDGLPSTPNNGVVQTGRDSVLVQQQVTSNPVEPAVGTAQQFLANPVISTLVDPSLSITGLGFPGSTVVQATGSGIVKPTSNGVVQPTGNGILKPPGSIIVQPPGSSVIQPTGNSVAQPTSGTLLEPASVAPVSSTVVQPSIFAAVEGSVSRTSVEPTNTPAVNPGTDLASTNNPLIDPSFIAVFPTPTSSSLGKTNSFGQVVPSIHKGSTPTDNVS
ncbi:hypothetical protein MJO28_002752 [Puccinia striiformis f. sp. tritici]|uniref:Cryptic loci regulator 2 N-terminal domain-containing protein n=2 Tax=Puccinia striiformis f. sp. tritici TaxID=168172 RepID=A0A0L0UUG7_9BASI|nr:hypothetical protein Pst134EB_006372 [Puccinia striiformis f. sp. tritici]KAI7958961.1 hypothetical protein MJO28_002752 [Puccinia striiformis f. sp. tritici]KNE90576.1 hypothetical protein PSTG_15995 [Puccinia striiformis f. sp. tritici PST-78]